MKGKAKIRSATMADLSALLEIDREIWPDFPATEEMFKSRIETFPEGQFVAVIDGKMVGSVFSQLINYEDWESRDFTWDEITDFGTIRQTHNPKGDSVYGVGLAVLKKYQGSGISQLLIIEVIRLCIERVLQQILLGTRIPAYHRHSEMSVDKYIFSTDSSGRSLDPELRLYQKYGSEVVKALPKYINDPESLDYGVLIKWLNPIQDLEGERFFNVDDISSSMLGRTVKRLTLLLPGRGCAWYKSSGGCTMCGFSQKLEEVNKRWTFSSSDLIGLFELAELLSRSEEPEILSIFNGGSFLNENEIPLETQLAIAKAVGSHPTLEALFVESRPEFVTEERLLQLLDVIGEKRLEVGIGLESVTDVVRENYIHKGFNLQSYERAVKILKGHGVNVLTYVFLKPLNLSEREAIEEAVKTIAYAFEVGSDEVSLSSAFIQEGTKMADFYKRGEFKPPWLWSIIDVVRQTAHLGPVRIGSFEDEPPPIAIPHNCDKCSLKTERALHEYNLTRDINVFDDLSCECQKQWLEEIKKA